jgi:hypothetical protein
MRIKRIIYPTVGGHVTYFTRWDTCKYIQDTPRTTRIPHYLEYILTSQFPDQVRHFNSFLRRLYSLEFRYVWLTLNFSREAEREFEGKQADVTVSTPVAGNLPALQFPISVLTPFLQWKRILSEWLSGWLLESPGTWDGLHYIAKIRFIHSYKTPASTLPKVQHLWNKIVVQPTVGRFNPLHLTIMYIIRRSIYILLSNLPYPRNLSVTLLRG